MQTSLIIMAAGMGSRYGGLKQLDPVGPNGEAILDYSVYDAMRAGIDKIVFIIRHDFEEQFKNEVASKYKGKIDVKLVFQDINDLPSPYTCPKDRTKPWGTAHAILPAKDEINGPFGVINADDFYGCDSYKVLHNFLVGNEISDELYAMVGFKLANTLSENGSVARGICAEDSKGNLTNVDELKDIFKTENGAQNRPDKGEVVDLTGNEPVSMNFWAFTPYIFETFERRFPEWLSKNINVEKSEFLIPEEIDKMIKEGLVNVKVLKTDSKWFGVTYKQDKPNVMASIKDLINKGVYPEKLF